MVLEKGDSLQSGKYQIVRQLGGGGFGLTYLAEDSALQRQVVIKTPNRVFQQDQEYQKFINRFQREGQVLAKISHPSVVRVLEYFEEQGMPCLVMDYVQGETLNEYIRRQGPLTQNEALQCFRQLAAALQQIHQADLIHCDIHPGNIILRQVSEPVLIDFGSTKSLQPSTRTVTTTVNDFVPYEQGHGQEKPKPTLDIYSLAATLYLAVTGRKPMSAMNRKLYGTALQAPKEHQAELSDWLSQAILKGMALESKDRPQSMQAWIGLLHPPQPQRPPPSVEKVIQPSPSPPTSQQSKPAFPWVSLGFLILGYVPVGIILRPNNLAVAVAWAGAWAVTWAVAVAGTWAVAVAVTVTAAVIWFLTWAWAWAVATAVAAAVAAAVAWAVAAAGNWKNVSAWTLSLSLLGALLGGTISGLFNGLGIWVSVGYGVCGFVQFWWLLASLGFSVEALDRRYSPTARFFILGIVSSLGLLLGGGLGRWLG
jgi:tRNA A-37 threonylcarbamoyl transferase component Bud32